MSRDPRVDELLAPLREDASEPGRLVEIDRDRVLARMSAAAKSAPSGGARLETSACSVPDSPGSWGVRPVAAARRRVRSVSASPRSRAR
jgi:hypothetical protein